jgi:hypothetical protein
MLDYRAHKLFWLITLPIRIAGKLSFFLCVGIGIIIAQQTSYNFWIKAAIAYASMEGLMIFVAILWFILTWAVKTLFFWIVDVIPARGADETEAREIVEKGRIIWLSKKFATDIENWTYNDTVGFVSVMNWRARLLFDARNRVAQRVRILVNHREETGKEPGSLTPAEWKELLGHLDASWFEKSIVNNYYFNSLMGIAIILFALNAWG